MWRRFARRRVLAAVSRRLQVHREDEAQSDRDLASVSVRLAGNVRRLRVAADFSQEQLAERAGLEASYLQKVERHAANVSLRVLGAIARALIVDVSVLLRPVRPVLRPNGRPPTRPARARTAVRKTSRR